MGYGIWKCLNMYHCRHQTKGYYTPLAPQVNRGANCTGYHLPPPQNPIKGGDPSYSHTPGFHMGCIVPTPGHGLYRPNTWTVLYRILRQDSGYIIPTSYCITICRTSRAGQRAWLPLASMPLINQGGQYKSDSNITGAVGPSYQCIFNIFLFSKIYHVNNFLRQTGYVSLPDLSPFKGHIKELSHGPS